MSNWKPNASVGRVPNLLRASGLWPWRNTGPVLQNLPILKRKAWNLFVGNMFISKNTGQVNKIQVGLATWYMFTTCIKFECQCKIWRKKWGEQTKVWSGFVSALGVDRAPGRSEAGGGKGQLCWSADRARTHQVNQHDLSALPWGLYAASPLPASEGQRSSLAPYFLSPNHLPPSKILYNLLNYCLLSVSCN